MNAPKPELYNICYEIAEPLVGSDDEEILNAAIVLLASMFVGRHAIRISKATGIDRQFCVWVGLRMRHSGRWKNEIYEDWLHESDGDFRLALDTFIAVGDVSGRMHNGELKVKLGGFMSRQVSSAEADMRRAA